MLKGVRKISLFQHLRKPALGTVADDWRAVGNDIRKAEEQFAATCE